MSFLDDNYLLSSKAAVRLYEEVEDLPIVDAHNHLDIDEILDNQPWADAWEVEGATDHYVWEMMRRRGVSEDLVTGSASNHDKWKALCRIFPELVGNPAYEWIQLDLKRRFLIQAVLCEQNAEHIWKKVEEELQDSRMLPQELLREMKVEIMCTTDDPSMSLPGHEKAATEVSCTRILPTWRPDKCSDPSHPRWKPFIEKLGSECGEDTSRMQGLLDCLEKTHQYFDRLGCVASDHGMEAPTGDPVSGKEAEKIHAKAYRGEVLSGDEIKGYMAFMLSFYGSLNAARDWVTQLHIGACRDYRDSLLKNLGPDSGGDVSIQNIDFTRGLRHFLNEFDEKMHIVLYCLDPSHLPSVATLARAFSSNVQVGAPWWFNDSPYGMRTQLEYIASVDALANLAGMVTDSRKLISFGSRTEMFRRVLCDVAGRWIEMGQAPEGYALDLVTALSYERPRELFFRKKV